MSLLVSVNCTKVAVLHAGAALQADRRIDLMLLLGLAGDSVCRTDSCAERTALTLGRIDLVIKQCLTYLGRTFVIFDMGFVLIAEIPEG